MKFFVDTAELNEIEELYALGLVDGVTTNPSLILKSGQDLQTVMKAICALVPGPVSVEVKATNYVDIMKEALFLTGFAPNICIKLPMTLDGLKACKTLTDAGHQTNVTLCFSANQALLAAKAGATFVSPFIGRLDDLAIDGMTLIGEIRTIFDNYDFKTQILAASIRTVNHVKDAALIGADVATIPPKILKTLVTHPLTDKGLEIFNADWAKSGQKIL